MTSGFTEDGFPIDRGHDTLEIYVQQEHLYFPDLYKNDMEIHVSHHEVEQFQRILYADLGKVNLVDEDYKPDANLDSAITYLADDPSFSFSLANHALATLAALCDQDVTGKTLLDLGAGYGILGKVALEQGAKKVYSVESSFDCQVGFDIQNPGSRNVFVPGYIDSCADRPAWLPQDEISLVVANIGPHEIYGATTHFNAIWMLEYLPSVQTFIGGGYAESPKHPTLNPREAIALCGELGFTKYSIYRIGQPDVPTDYWVSFVAKKPRAP